MAGHVRQLEMDIQSKKGCCCGMCFQSNYFALGFFGKVNTFLSKELDKKSQSCCSLELPPGLVYGFDEVLYSLLYNVVRSRRALPCNMYSVEGKGYEY